jgi:putative DNA primase/helicase
VAGRFARPRGQVVIDFSKLNGELLGRARSLLPAWLPGGKWEGREWAALNPTRADHHAGSFKANADTGHWSDFATGDRGGDLVSLFAYVQGGLKQSDAATRLMQDLGLSNGHRANDKCLPDTSYEIRDETGELIATKYRVNGHDGGKKQMWLERKGQKGLSGMPVTDLPLYGSQETAQWSEDSAVVLTEGEKCADRLRKFGVKALGTACGAATIPNDERLKLVVRFAEVILWADNDDAGNKHMRRIGERLLAFGLTSDRLRWIDVARVEGLEQQGADAADLDDSAIREALDAATIPFPREASAQGAEATPSEEDARPPEFSDDALAVEFVAAHVGDLRYVAALNEWLEFDGARWRPDKTLRAFDLARLNNRRIADRAARTLEPKVAARICPALTGAKAIAATITLARCDRLLASRVEDWDRDPWLLNTPPGVVDLRTGELREHRPADYMSKVTSVGPALGGTGCPIWRGFLDRIFAGDVELIGFMQRALGYVLTGTVREQVLFFLHGLGANGKSVFVTVMRAILSEYSSSVPMDALTVTSYQQHPTELTDLRGARFASAIETESGRRWAEARIKALTGGDAIKARRMRQDFFEFQPTHKLFVCGNHRPRLGDVDEAIRRRFLMIPFDVTIPKEQRDQELPNKIIAVELPAILSWTIEGCLEWQRIGLAPPSKVLAATDEYLTSQDSLAQWIAECCITGPNESASSRNLFADWKRHAEEAHEYIGTQRGLTTRLADRGYQRFSDGAARGFRGIRPVNPPPLGEGR